MPEQTKNVPEKVELIITREELPGDIWNKVPIHDEAKLKKYLESLLDDLKMYKLGNPELSTARATYRMGYDSNRNPNHLKKSFISRSHSLSGNTTDDTTPEKDCFEFHLKIRHTADSPEIEVPGFVWLHHDPEEQMSQISIGLFGLEEDDLSLEPATEWINKALAFYNEKPFTYSEHQGHIHIAQEDELRQERIYQKKLRLFQEEKNNHAHLEDTNNSAGLKN